LLIFGNKKLPRNASNVLYHKLEVELLAGEGRISEARELVASNKHLQDVYHGYLLSDLSNSALCGTKTEYDRWLEGFNKPFIENDLLPITPSDSFIHSFDELNTQAATIHDTGPKVSVIMTVFNPDPRGFQLSVKSILKQTWRNLELIIVDDASPKAFQETLEQVAATDHRINLVRLPRNQGTYA